MLANSSFADKLTTADKAPDTTADPVFAERI